VLGIRTTALLGKLRFEPWMGWAAMAAIAGIAFLLHHDLGLYALIGNVHDDALFFRLATYVRRGEWLGPYSQMTLAKGPMLPILIAGSWWAGAGIKDVEFVVSLAAAATMATVAKRLSGSWGLTIVVFAALALDPLPWDMSMMRLLREPLYGALSLTVVALVALLVLDEPGGSRRRRIALAVVLGFIFAAYWLTREESSWLYPALAVILAYGIYLAMRAGATGRRESAMSSLLFGAVSGGAFALGLLPVKALNWSHYGTTDTTEFRAGPFQDAYGALTRIEARHPSRYIPVPRAARRLAYGVSPAANELRPFLEGGVGRMWTSISCWAIGTTLCQGDMAGGWLMWALRDAVALAGHYDSPQDASAYYARMAHEIDAACDSRRIPCSAPRHTFAPPLEIADIGPLAHSMVDALSMLSRVEAQPIAPLTSPGDPAKLAAWQKGLGRVAPPAHAQAAGLSVSGWVSTRSEPSLEIADAPGRAGAPVSCSAAPDVDTFMRSSGRGDMVNRRFTFSTPCVGADCRLVVRAGDVTTELPLAGLAPGPGHAGAGVTLNFDSVSRYDGGPSGRGPGEALKYEIVDAEARVLGIVFPVLWVTALVGLGMHLLFNRRERSSNAVATLALSCLAAVLTRAFITAYLDVSSWTHAVNHVYLAPAYGFGVVFAICGTYLLLRAVRALRATTSPVANSGRT
jgi:hypothetical protein